MHKKEFGNMWFNNTACEKMGILVDYKLNMCQQDDVAIK